MQANIQLFTNDLFGTVRSAVLYDNNIWFIGSDIANGLGYQDPTQAIRYHVREEDKTSVSTNLNAPTIVDRMGRIQYPIWINESGVYSLIFGSKKINAMEFKRWFTSSILPAMREQIQINTYARLDRDNLLFNIINYPSISIQDKINIITTNPLINYTTEYITDCISSFETSYISV